MNFNIVNKEILFQVIFHLVVFVFYAFERNQTGIEPYKYAYFINYAITAGIINYICLPIFYKRKNAFMFAGLIALCILTSALVEELVLEKFFFSGQRAASIKLLWAFIDIIPVVAILSGVKFGWDAIMKQKEVDKLEELVKESELQFLKSQINPHFLFNNMNNLYSYALEGSKKTPEIIIELSGLLRYMLYDCKEKYVSLTKEVEQLKNFVNLNELQIEDRGHVNLSIQKMDESYQIAPLILIVFVENAFKHSQSSQSDEIEIEIYLEIKDDGKLYFKCINTYNKIANNANLDQGIGLENVKKRLELIYPNAYELSLRDKRDLYMVDLLIDLNKGQKA